MRLKTSQGRINSDNFGPGSDKLNTCRVDLSPKEFFEHDGAGNAKLAVEKTLSVSAGERIQLKVGSTTMTLTADSITLAAGGGRAVLDGRGLRGTPDVFADNISGKTHTHGGVQSGASSTGSPK